MEIFVINLPRSHARREAMIQESEKYDLNIKFFDAVDGGELTVADKKRLLYNPDNNLLTNSEIGCALSHIMLYRKIVEEGIPFALILEDDVGFDFDPRPLLAAIEAYGANECAVYNFAHWHKTFTRSIARDVGDFQFYRAFDAFGTYGYVITKAAAEKLAKFLMPVRAVADDWKYMLKSGLIRMWMSDKRILRLKEVSKSSTIEEQRSAIMRDEAERRRRRAFDCRVHKLVPFSAQFRRLAWKIFARPLLTFETLGRLDDDDSGSEK